MYLTMSTSQFIHVEVFARKGSQWRRSCRDVLEEAARKPWAIPHVERPLKPALLSGPTLGQLLDRHNDIVETARWVDGRGVPCRVRMDTPTMIAAVASYPIPLAEVGKIVDTARAVQFWMRDTITWWNGHISAKGGEPQSAVSHLDETYPHLHLFALHPAGPVLSLHPGRSAKREAAGTALQAGMDRKQANKVGNDAYRKAMRKFQDEYWEAVGIKHGMTRRGAGRTSLKRAEYMERKADTDILARQRVLLERAAADLGVDLDQFLREISEREAEAA